jgi:hypothetical protein
VLSANGHSLGLGDQWISKTLSLQPLPRSAQTRLANFDAHINPDNLMRNSSAISEDAVWDNRHNNYARLVTFDVGLTAPEGTSANAKVGVVAGMFNLGAGGASENKQQAINRVQCSVPVLFPFSQLPEDARKGRFST